MGRNPTTPTNPRRVEINRVGIAGFVNSKSGFFCKFMGIACKWLWGKDLRRGAGGSDVTPYMTTTYNYSAKIKKTTKGWG